MENENNDYPCLLCHQRRGHDADCVFGEYFPGDRANDFDDACRLFGLSNILRLMRFVEPNEREATANSILNEGSRWRMDPIRGVLGYELNLRSQLEYHERYLQTVINFLSYCQNQAREVPNLGISDASHAPQPGTQLGVSSTQTPNLGGEIFPGSYERGEPSNIASGQRKNVEDQKELGVDDKEETNTSDKDSNARG